MTDKIPEDSDLVEEFVANFESAFESTMRLSITEQDQNDPNQILKYSSDKLNSLVDLIRNINAKPQLVHSIVFVERRSIAFYLNSLLSKLSQLEEWKFIRSDFLFSICKSSNIDMDKTKQV